jgi:hypothetical protein
VGSGRGFEGDLVAECLELADVVASFGLGVDVAVVVIGAELVEAGVGVGEQVPDDHEDRAADRDNGLHLASSAGNAAVASARLEIEAALKRNVRIIPILVDGASIPRVDELPAGLTGLVRRQALEVSPSRFEYDTSRLLKVLDMTLAEVRKVRDDEAVTSAAPHAVENTQENEVPVAGTAADLLAGEDSTTTQPAAHPSDESTGHQQGLCQR